MKSFFLKNFICWLLMKKMDTSIFDLDTYNISSCWNLLSVNNKFFDFACLMSILTKVKALFVWFKSPWVSFKVTVFLLNKFLWFLSFICKIKFFKIYFSCRQKLKKKTTISEKRKNSAILLGLFHYL